MEGMGHSGRKVGDWNWEGQKRLFLCFSNLFWKYNKQGASYAGKDKDSNQSFDHSN